MSRFSTTYNNQFRIYLQLGKFRLCTLVLFTTFVGYGLGVNKWDLFEIISLLLGTLLTAMGANGLNQWWERDRDAKMARTRNRPLPLGKLSVNHALFMTLSWSVSGVTLLLIGVNALTAYLAILTIVTYLFIYTPMKPYSPIAVLAGAIPGAIPPMMGWTAATNTFSIQAWGLGCLLFLWQIPHFMSLAAVYRQDYAKGGYHLLPDNPEVDIVTRSIIVVFSLALLGITLLVPSIGLGERLFFVCAFFLGSGMLFMSIKLYTKYSIQNARRMFRASIIYIPTLMIILLIDERMFG
ncbi:MAG: protoheme IX farnesyltransferase [Paraglaciecola sp.]|jgi:protoheme IX farnesyltransferase